MLTRRAALKGGSATVAVAASGLVAVEDSPVAAAARTFWKAHTRCMAIQSRPDLTDEEWDDHYYPWIQAYERLMEIPSSSVKDLAIKIPVCREVWHGCEVKVDDPKRLGALFAEIERLAGRAES